ncbi:zinc-dependent metalloprotease [Bifidobacterium magnum]|uniref:Hydrolase n=1 Tax=Bifidobacterium magnum TaxID=1692 RepID=A0A087BDR6_9BIFI|nr:zinc-dependent metalloprotease [Bifidobacterium magnum]KFI69166.1 hypothetical protein BMAGN_0930 [Bifidobacterium magnum]
MDDNAIHQWLIECFGPVQGEMAWKQLEQLPPEIREQLASQGELPDPARMRAMMQAMNAGGLNSFTGMQNAVDQGPINIALAKSLALQQANASGSDTSVSATDGAQMRRIMSEVNLWLDTACEFNPPAGEAEALTRDSWVEGTIDSWANFAAPVARSMNEALTSVISERLGDAMQGEITGMFAGPVPIPIPDNMKDPKQIMKLFANTSYAMQLGQAAGDLSREVRGSFDQGIALLNNPAGGLIVQNVKEYAKSLDLDETEVMEFLALHEAAYARLYANVPWLMPRFEALLGKYARGITIDMDAMEEQLREAAAMDPESLSGAVNLANVGITDTPEQRAAMRSIETLLALVEGWVDCVVWRAGMPHIAHMEQLREMMRRERAVGGPAECTFEALMGLQLRPKRMREAAALWEQLTLEGADARDAKWSHPDLLPALPDEESAAASGSANGAGAGSASADQAQSASKGANIDWDDELSKLLNGELSDPKQEEPKEDSSAESSDDPQNTAEESDNGTDSTDPTDSDDEKPQSGSGE